jgi:hypothetical protein
MIANGDAGDGAHPLQHGLKRLGSLGEAGVELGYGGVEEIDVGQHLRDQQPVVDTRSSRAAIAVEPDWGDLRDDLLAPGGDRPRRRK